MSCFRKRLNIFLELVGRQLFFFFFYRKGMRIIQYTLKIEKKVSALPNKVRVGPKKVRSVGFPETRQFLFWPKYKRKIF